MPPDERRSDSRVSVGLRVRLAYASVDEFVDRFAANVSRGGLFVRTREPRAVGTAVSFELLLHGGERVVRGTGVVRWISREDQAGLGASGMGIQFTGLDPPSQELVDRMVALREERARGDPPPPQPAAPPGAAPPPPPPPLTPVRRVERSGGGPLPSPAQANLAAPHEVQRIPEAPAEADLGVPSEPPLITRASRHVVGIDLGTTNSCAAFVRDGKPYVIPSREGYNTVPSIVALSSRNGLLVGHLARGQLLSNPRHTVHGAKRLLGRPFDSRGVRQMRESVAYEIAEGEDGMAVVALGPHRLSLEQVSALVLREVKEVAQNHLGEEVNRAVITVPAYYTERQREAVRRAGALAGLRVERILNEPTAAAIAYASGRTLQQRVLVYDLGGGTFDASLLELSGGVYEVVSTGGDTFLGGMDFDARIVERLLQRYQEQLGRPFDGDRVALSRIADAAERAKCSLSERQEQRIQLPFLTMMDGQPVGLDTALTRSEIAGLVEPLVDRTIEVCREVLRSRGLEPKDVEEVILVGGQSRMPLVQEKVRAFFGRPPSKQAHPDEAVAIGAALLADSLGKAAGPVLVDVLPVAIGLELPGGKVKPVFQRNTPLPARKQYAVSTSEDGQTEISFVIVQGDDADACEHVETVTLEGLPVGPRGMVRVAVLFELGAECLLTVTAREVESGRAVRVKVSKLGRSASRRGAAPPAASLPTVVPTAPEAAGPPGHAAAPAPARPRGGGLGALLRRLFRG